jgi:2-haloacid dehalogenase
MSPSPSSFRAVVFDAYGTVFDVHSAVGRHAGRLGANAAPFSDLWRVKQLEYSWTRSLMARTRDFWALTEDALDFAMARFGVSDPALRSDLLSAYEALSAFPEVAAALQALRGQGLRAAILSNGSPAMLDSAVRSAGLASSFEAVLSLHGLGTFKPPAAAYEPVLSALGVARSEVLFVSSNRWDVAGAAAFGFLPVWCNRSGAPDEYPDLPPLATIADLAALPALAASLQIRP